MYFLESLVKPLSSSSKELSWLVKNVCQLCFQTQTSSIASTAIDGILVLSLHLVDNNPHTDGYLLLYYHK